MTYEKFLDCLERELQKKSREGEQIRLVCVLKNNGVKLDGFSCQVQGHREQPTVYVGHYYREDMEPGEIGPVAELVIRIMRDSILEPGQRLDQILNYERMKKQIFYRLISREQNRELLEEIPHIPWLDLEIVFYIRVPEEMVKRATALIRRNHMEHWGLGTEELYRVARENMAGIPIFLHPMEQILDEACGMGGAGSGMYVLSNHAKEFGAALIVDPKVQRLCARKFGGDYYILPSSIHEVILLPGSAAMDKNELDELVREVNGSCMNREDVLSGHAYFYSGTSGTIHF